MFSTIYFKAQCFGGLIVFLCMYLWIFNILFFVFKSTDQGTSIVGWSLDSPLFSLVSLAAIVCIMLTWNHAILFPVLFLIKHNSSSFHPPAEDLLLLTAEDSLFPSSLQQQFLHSQGSAPCPLGSTVKSSFLCQFLCASNCRLMV